MATIGGPDQTPGHAAAAVAALSQPPCPQAQSQAAAVPARRAESDAATDAGMQVEKCSDPSLMFSESDIQEVRESVRDIIPDDTDLETLEGALLWEFVEEKWALPEGARLTPVRLWDEHGKIICKRDAVNMRKVQATVLKYGLWFLKRGFMAQCRGKLIMVVMPGGVQLLFVGGGTLMEAMLMAAALQPNNRFVKNLREQGISAKHTLQLKPDTPLKVKAWVKKVHNQWHVGNGNTLEEHFDLCDSALSKWEGKRLTDNISTASCPKTGSFSYESCFKRFISNSFADFRQWEYFDNLKAFMSKARLFKCMAEVRVLVESKVDTLHPRLQNQSVAAHLNKVAVVLEGFTDAWKPEVLGRVLAISAEFALPILSDDLESLKVAIKDNAQPEELATDSQWVLTGPVESKGGVLARWLEAPMAGSMLYRDDEKTRLKALKEHEKTTKREEKLERQRAKEAAKIARKHAPRKTKKGDTTATAEESSNADAAGAEEQPQSGLDAPPVSDSEPVCEPAVKKSRQESDPIQDVQLQTLKGQSRPKMALDEILCSIYMVMTKVMLHEDVHRHESFTRAVRKALSFVWHGRSEVNGREIKEWSKFKKELQVDLIKDNEAVLKANLLPTDAAKPFAAVSTGSSSTANLSSAEITAKILEMLEVEEQDQNESLDVSSWHRRSESCGRLWALVGQQEFVIGAYEYLQKNNTDAPVHFHQEYIAISSGMSERLHLASVEATNPGTFPTNDVIELIVDQVVNTVPLWCGQLALSLVGVQSEHTDLSLEVLSNGVFVFSEQLEKFSRLPVLYMLAMLETLTCGNMRVTTDDLTLFITTLQGLVADVVAVETNLEGICGKKAFWKSLLQLPKISSPLAVVQWLESYFSMSPSTEHQRVQALEVAQTPASGALEVAQEIASGQVAGAASGSVAVIASETPFDWSLLDKSFTRLSLYQHLYDGCVALKPIFMKCMQSWLLEVPQAPCTRSLGRSKGLVGL